MAKETNASRYRNMLFKTVLYPVRKLLLLLALRKEAKLRGFSCYMTWA